MGAQASQERGISFSILFKTEPRVLYEGRGGWFSLLLEGSVSPRRANGNGCPVFSFRAGALAEVFGEVRECSSREMWLRWPKALSG